MTLQKQIVCIIIAVALVAIMARAVQLYAVVSTFGTEGLERPTVETRTTVYVVPWPWELVYQDKALWMRLDIEGEQ
ncbi:hypothetical protein SAMN04515656_11221 [Eubacterium aggregans]|uniref:Uncharacterized protein n=1 Tax=Eubacterium aggregans TaxID=81409 RepID=A0A1H4BP56_9FIRM|nr:hypothetical protein [Eubacterium aggregans]SEA49896.1 hypothetical protein SAMN04515656_11221 [Eubacterium aggregans]